MLCNLATTGGSSGAQVASDAALPLKASIYRPAEATFAMVTSTESFLPPEAEVISLGHFPSISRAASSTTPTTVVTSGVSCVDLAIASEAPTDLGFVHPTLATAMTTPEVVEAWGAVVSPGAQAAKVRSGNVTIDKGRQPMCTHCGQQTVWSDFTKGGFRSGWNCNNNGSTRCGGCSQTMGSWRWLCTTCESSICNFCWSSGVKDLQLQENNDDDEDHIGSLTMAVSIGIKATNVEYAPGRPLTRATMSSLSSCKRKSMMDRHYLPSGFCSSLSVRQTPVALRTS